jgi:APA family basic amino acid/polyamine antiporter
LFSLPSKTISRFFIWNLLGIAVYVLYGRARSVLVSGTVPDRAA